MKAEIIAVGTELLLGQIVNTNAQFLSEQLAALGIPVYFHSVVGDNAERLQQQLTLSTARSSLIFITGGLGPTKDDLTKETLSSFTNLPLVVDRQAMENIEHYFAQRQRRMTENNRRQALVLEGATIFPNETGLAPGMAIETKSCTYLLFPGPPSELIPMFERYAIPYLQGKRADSSVVHSKVMRFCGIGESELETRLQDLIEQQTSPTIAPLAKEDEVTLRLTSRARSIADAEAEMREVIDEVRKRVGEYLYGWDQDTLEQVIISEFKQRAYTLATAESCTGGRIGALLTSVHGASDVFLGSMICYSNQVKRELLQIPQQMLEQYGAVSEQVAARLAENVSQMFGATFGLSVTGVAGPSMLEDQPVGLVYIGISHAGQSTVQTLRLAGDRESIQRRAAKYALYALWNHFRTGQ
jgi:nicotinamide-nucleotide amidase